MSPADVPLRKAYPSSFHLGDEQSALLHVAAVVDPISEQAQQWSSLLEVCLCICFRTVKADLRL